MRGWARRPLAQLALRISDGSHNPPKGVDVSEYMMLSSKNVFDDQISFDAPRYLSAADFKIEDRRTSVAAGDVLLTIVGTIGRTAVVPVDAPAFTLQRSVAVIRPDNSTICSRFLMYALMSGSGALNAQARGVAQKGIYLEALREFGIDHPPLPEQRRIVAILDEAFEGVATVKANAERNLQNARDLFASHMQSLFAQAGTWERVPLEELLARGWITSHLDGNHGSDYPRKEEFVDAGVPYIAARAIKAGTVDFDEAKYLSPERAATIRKGLAKDRDVLFAHNATVGPVAILSTDEDVVILGTSLTYYRCDPQHIHPEYLAHFMVSPAFTSQYTQVMRQSTRNQVPITKQRELFHVIPPLHVQRLIADALDELSVQTERLAAIAMRKLSALDELKKSLLHQAFNGAL